MRETGHTLSRLFAVRALVAGAALFAGASVPAACAWGKGGNDQTAMAIPRIGAPDQGGGHGGDGGFAALPRPLSPGEAARVRRIFADQRAGRMTEAQALTDRLGSDLLLGSILADRYLGPFHRSTVPELTAWLARFGTEPDAPALRGLLLQRLPPGRPLTPSLSAVLKAPPPRYLAPAAAPDLAGSATPTADPAASSRTAASWLERDVAARVRAGAFDVALRLITQTRGLRPAAAAALRAKVARGLFVANRDAAALRVAAMARREAGGARGPAGPPAYVAGLAAWRLGKLQDAGFFFATAARAPGAPSSLRAAGAFWAGRVALRRGYPSAAEAWFRRAAGAGQTFYGLIARRTLGWGISAMFAHATLSDADLDALAALPQGRLAFALLQVGQTTRAEAALRCLWPAIAHDPPLRRALMLVAARAGMPELAGQIAARIQEADGIPPQNLHFPMPTLHPEGGFRIDPALVYGMTRAESNFDAQAVSPAGARGLMQITPITARAVTGNWHLTGASLHNPGFNLEVGQRLIRGLALRTPIDGDLIGLLASYNAGLGSYLSWHNDVRDGGDPLLFIEAIPIRQTRIFVERGLAYTWLYAARLGLASPSLDAIADGSFPRFSPAAAPMLVSLH
ncbi:MAG TPA: transglycosylase SLT domain-containing protein [Acetobacteraceae bacterium]|nr:transglycosylase SLT domain-containing protein [Acetobacteraceae bacterium]